ncbi:unnamed protein product, partial [Effrenium voratum]
MAEENALLAELSPGTAGLDLGPDAKDRFYGNMSGVEVEKELIRQGVLMQTLLRDFSIMKDAVGHLEDESGTAKELAVKSQLDCRTTALELRQELDAKMRSMTFQVDEATSAIVRSRKEAATATQALRDKMEAFHNCSSGHMESAIMSLEDCQTRVLDRFETSQRALQDLRTETSAEMAKMQKAAADVRQDDQAKLQQNVSELEVLVRKSTQQVLCDLRLEAASRREDAQKQLETLEKK